MRLPRIQIGIRWLMVAVLVAGGILGWRQHRVYQRLREEYEEQAEGFAILEEEARLGASISHEEWLAQCREIDRRNRKGPFVVLGGRRLFFSEPHSPEVHRQHAEEWDRMNSSTSKLLGVPGSRSSPTATPTRSFRGD